MKKILIFIDWYEPGYKAGGPIRSVKNLVDHFKGEAEFFIFTRDRDYQANEPYKEVEADKWVQSETNIQVYYCSPEALSKSTIEDVLQSGSFDRIYINSIYSWYFSVFPLLLMNRQQRSHTIVAARGMLAKSAIGVKSLKKNLFLQLAKMLSLYKGVSFHATSAQEQEDIRIRLGQQVPVIVASNLPAVIHATGRKVIAKKDGGLRLVSIARISPEKNTLFALKALQALPESVCVSLDLYGPVYDGAYWNECTHAIQQLPEHVKVCYKGNLPNEQVHEKLKEYHFFYLPSRGENFGHGILEAFTAGVPVIISDQTPWKGLKDMKRGFELPLQEKLFAEALQVAAAMEEPQYNEWSKAAYEYAQQVRKDPVTLKGYREMFGV